MYAWYLAHPLRHRWYGGAGGSSNQLQTWVALGAEEVNVHGILQQAQTGSGARVKLWVGLAVNADNPCPCAGRRRVSTSTRVCALRCPSGFHLRVHGPEQVGFNLPGPVLRGVPGRVVIRVREHKLMVTSPVHSPGNPLPLWSQHRRLGDGLR